MPKSIPPTRSELLAELTERITSGELEPGAQLPSTRELATYYDVSQRTVATVLATLREQGLVVGVPGRGVFVASPDV